jgi:sugar fermentation stimulation protein A
MKYENVVSAEFRSRLNRFTAAVLLDGREDTVHVKNTGRLRELLVPGRRVALAPASNPNRKTRFDLIAAEKPGLGWVNIDSQACNQVVGEWLETRPAPFEGLTRVQPEFSYGSSRFDFYFEQGERMGLMEVKGCTLELEGFGYFPDAPTDRGVKHLRELSLAARAGYDCYLVYVIAMPGVKQVLPNERTDPAFAKALADAMAAGVRVVYLACEVSADEIAVINCAEAESKDSPMR